MSTRRATLAALRARAIAEIVAEEVTRYLAGSVIRRCAYCGRTFKCRTRWHFFCGEACRRHFYRGAFRPRAED